MQQPNKKTSRVLEQQMLRLWVRGILLLRQNPLMALVWSWGGAGLADPGKVCLNVLVVGSPPLCMTTFQEPTERGDWHLSSALCHSFPRRHGCAIGDFAFPRNIFKSHVRGGTTEVNVLHFARGQWVLFISSWGNSFHNSSQEIRNLTPYPYCENFTWARKVVFWIGTPKSTKALQVTPDRMH